jgi:hypothetical protein
VQVRVDRYADAGDFLGAAESWLSADEVANNVMLSIARSLADGTRTLTEPPYFAAVTEGGEIDCCAIQTPPHRILLTHGTPRGSAALAADAFEARGRVPGVIGPGAATASFAEEWLRLAGGQARVSMRQRLHKLERGTVIPSVRAVFRFGASLKRVGCSVGILARLAPRRRCGPAGQTRSHAVQTFLGFSARSR